MSKPAKNDELEMMENVPIALLEERQVGAAGPEQMVPDPEELQRLLPIADKSDPVVGKQKRHRASVTILCKDCGHEF